MKKIILLFLVIVLTGCSQGFDIDTSEFEDMEAIERILSEDIIDFKEMHVKDNMIILNDQAYEVDQKSSVRFEYDDEGRVYKIISEDNSISTNIYENGLHTERISEDPNSQYPRIQQYIYDEKDRLIEERYIWKENDPITTRIIEYHDDYEFMRAYYSEMERHHIAIYNDEGKYNKVVAYNSDDEIIGVTRYYYENGLETLQIISDGTDQIRINQKVYDQHDNLILTHMRWLNFNDYTIIHFKDHEYNDQGQVITSTSYSSSSASN